MPEPVSLTLLAIGAFVASGVTAMLVALEKIAKYFSRIKDFALAGHFKQLHRLANIYKRDGYFSLEGKFLRSSGNDK
jgi:hypothetical protein